MKPLYSQLDRSTNYSRTFSFQHLFTFLLIMGFSLFTFQSTLFAQAPCSGEIYTNNIGLGNPVILDPNQDGRITAGTGQDFPDGTTEVIDFESLLTNATGSCDCEVGWTKFAGLISEPDSDTQTSGTCGNTDIVSDDDGGQDHAYYTVIDADLDNDQDCSTNPENLMIVFRIRVADKSSGAFSFEVLSNNDGKFVGDPGEVVACCNSATNPGFETEIQLATGGGSAGVNVYDIDNSIGNDDGPISSYDLATNTQVAVACGTDANCPAGADPVFYTFMLPLSELGFSDCQSALSNLSIIAVSSPSTNPVIDKCSSVSDVGGVDDGDTDNVACGAFPCPEGDCGTSNCQQGATMLCAAGSFNPPLPVEWVSFTAKTQRDEVELMWQTASEENNAGFEIQRTSDARNWETIGSVEGRGTTSELQTYYFTDARPLSGYNYYRLKQTDYDGKFDFSEIQTVLMDNQNKKMLEIFPNPNNGTFKLSLHNPDAKKARIKLFDSTGNLIWEHNFKNSNESLHWEKEFNLPQREIYFVVTQIGDQIDSQKITVIDQK